MSLADIWLPVFRKDQSLWLELDLRLRHFEKLLKRIPLSDAQKLKLTQETVKEKSGYFACLVNRNIDLLLLTEFFETKKSRNILLNRETERYMRVFNGYSMSGKTNLTAVYQYLDAPEESVKQNSSADLFSGFSIARTAPVISEELSEQLMSLEQFAAANTDIPFIFTALAVLWELAKNNGFDSRREALHYINYAFDAEGLKCYKLLNIEKGIAEQRTALENEKQTAEARLLLMHNIISEELNRKTELLKSLYREETGYEQMTSLQKIASNYLFSQAFDTALHAVKANDTEQKLLRQALRCGTVYPSEIARLFHLGRQAAEAQDFLCSAYFTEEKTSDGQVIWVISTSHFQPHRLSAYNNISEIISTHMALPVSQSAAAESVNAVNESLESEQTLKTDAPVRKAFFG